MKLNLKKYPYPRRRIVRSILRNLIRLTFSGISDFQIEGQENLPTTGPLLVVANHFSFLDPVAVIRATPWPLDFLGGTRTPNAPLAIDWVRQVYGIVPVFRGSVSRETFIASESILAQNGVLGIFPEGGSWATVLRPARPGTAFLASQTGAKILPVGLEGFDDFFPRLRKGNRPKAIVRFGKTFGPIQINVRNRENRRELDEAGHEIMRHIADLIPPKKRGYYSDDPLIREAALGTEIYPWENLQEE